jgi:hypothetical protein
VISGEDLRLSPPFFTFARRQGTFGRPMVDEVGPTPASPEPRRIDNVLVFLNNGPPNDASENTQGSATTPTRNAKPILSPRVYLDGGLVGLLERNPEPSGDQQLDLQTVFRRFKIDATTLHTMELIGEDRVLARFKWPTRPTVLSFTLSARDPKNLVFTAPKGSTPYPGPITVQAIALYRSAPSAEREIAKPHRRPRANEP